MDIIKEEKRINDNIEGPYYSAMGLEGPEGLEQIIATLLKHAQRDPYFAKKIHTISYECGQQKSWIKVDVEQRKVWYNDSLGGLLGRPAPTVIQKLFAKLSFDFYDVHSLKINQKIENTIANTFDSNSFHDHRNIQQDIQWALEELNEAIAGDAWKGRKNLGLSMRFFKPTEETQSREADSVLIKNKNPR